MRHAIRRAAPFILALAASSAAFAGPESLALTAGVQFSAAATSVQSGQFRPNLPPVDLGTFVDEQLLRSTTLPGVAARKTFTGAPSADIELAALLNSHLKTALHYRLSGRDVWFTGAFDQKQTAYVGVTVDGQPTRYFDIKALLNKKPTTAVGSATYALSLSGNIFHKAKSVIHFKNVANDREGADFQIQQMLDAVAAVGANVAVGGQKYKLYYTDGPTNGGADAGARLFSFIYGPTNDFHVYLVPESVVPADKMAVFSMFNGQKVGLARPNGRLQIFANP